MLVQPPSLSRRTFIGTGAVLLLSACSPDPTVHVSRTRTVDEASAGDKNSIDPKSLAKGAELEASLASWLELLAREAAALKAPAGTADWCRAVTSQCREHALVLLQDDPLRPGTSSALPSPSSAPMPAAWAGVVAELASRSKALVAHHRELASTSHSAAETLLHASLMVSAAAIHTVGPVPPRATVVPGHVTIGSSTQELTALVGHLRALAQGLEIGVGQLPLQDTATKPGARDRLQQVWTMRDQVLTKLSDDKAEVPAAEIDYRMPGKLDTPADIVATWGALEKSVLDARLRVAAASQGADRQTALDACLAQVPAVLARRSAVGVWPGWH